MSLAFEELLATIPVHLKQYVVDQNYDRYTSQDQAVWRYIMRRNVDFLKAYAHPAYLSGLEKTGISIEHIPDIDEMNASLAKIGWRAVIVDGFLPPAVFMEFQWHKILVISADIRSIKHILYTPAPDIVHEAAGHAPIIADEGYSQFLQKFGLYGTKAFSSKLDNEIYEAIRYLSIIKEYPDTTAAEIEKAEKNLSVKIAENTDPSEMALLSRLHWWTVEYGLIGSPEKYKLYGAGLLSSVGESKNCMSEKVKKLVLDMSCTGYNYDITKEQPQLFVNRDWEHLNDVLEEFASTMAFKIGGAKSIELAIKTEAPATIQLSSGLQISGVMNYLLKDEKGNPAFVRTKGETSLAHNDKLIDGHGKDYHHDGYSTPLGRIKNVSKLLEDMADSELEKLGIKVGRSTELLFESGMRLSGTVKRIIKRENRPLVISFSECTVSDNERKELFNPSWGVYDMALGISVPSVFSGTADKIKHNVFPAKSEKKAIAIDYSEKDKRLHSLYNRIRQMRDSRSPYNKEVDAIFEDLKNDYPNDWLLPLEIFELLKTSTENGEQKKILGYLEELKKRSDEKNDLLTNGLKLIN